DDDSTGRRCSANDGGIVGVTRIEKSRYRHERVEEECGVCSLQLSSTLLLAAELARRGDKHGKGAAIPYCLRELGQANGKSGSMTIVIEAHLAVGPIRGTLEPNDPDVLLDLLPE